MRTGIIICAAGNGSRTGSNIPKQFIYIGRKRVIDYTIEEVFSSGVFDDIIIMVRPEDLSRGNYSEYISRGAWVVKGDVDNAQETRRLGLEFCKVILNYQNTDIIGIADGNRPFIESSFYAKLVQETKTNGNAIPYVIQKEVLVLKDGEKSHNVNHKREEYLSTMAPCFFPFGVMYDAYNIAYENNTLLDTEGAVQVLISKLEKMNLTRWINYVEGKSIYFKITTMDDIELAKALMSFKEK